MLRCNRCGALWLVAFLTTRQGNKITKKHDKECPAREGEPSE